MATITKGRTFLSGETVTPAKLNSLVDDATISGIVNAEIAAGAAIVDTKLATIATPGKVSNSATTAVSTNTPNAIVSRDASGNFSANQITANVTGNVSGSSGSCTGNSATATQASNALACSGNSATATIAATCSGNSNTASRLQTPRTINGVSFNGSENITVTAVPVNGSVTQEKLSPSLSLIPPGAIIPFASYTPPVGWLIADGAAVSRSTYALLFYVIGTTFGAGNGSTTFNLPDLRGYFVRGHGTNSDGTQSGTWGVRQGDVVISHTHSGTTGNDSPDHTHSGGAVYPGSGPEQNQNGNLEDRTTFNIQTGGANVRHQHPFTTSSQSPAGDTETRPKNIALWYCIKF
jgi:microcystin-dependent protein